MNTPTDPKLTIEWLNKLVMMAQWKPKLPFYAVRLFSAPEQYERFRQHVKTGTTDDTDITDEAVRTAREKLLEAIGNWDLLKELFGAADDPFANATVDQLQLLAEVSDITTDPQKMVYSKNGTFLAVVEALRQSQEFDAEPLIVDGLNKFFTLLETNAAVAELLYNLAEGPYWLVVMASLREGRDYTGDEEPAVAQSLREWQAKLTTELRALLFKPGHLSRAPTKLIKMAWNNRQLFDEARNSIPAASRENDPFEERRQVANEALKLFKARTAVDYQQIEADLNVLATVARHYINVRKFAKLDGLVYTWPEIARLAMSNYPALEYVEDLLVNRKPRPADADLDAHEARDLYELCSRNDRLIRFLRLRPRFAEIDDDELRRYRPLAPVVITEATVQPSSSGASGAVDFTTASSAPSPSSSAAFANCVLQIEKDRDSNAEGEFIYKVSLQAAGTITVTMVSVAVSKLLEEISIRVAGGDSELQTVLRDLFASSPTEAELRMAAAGGSVGARFMLGEIADQVRKLLLKDPRIRLTVKSTEQEIHFLPWEWLPGLSQTQPLLALPDPSIVRDASPPFGSTQSVFLLAPLRLLSIIPPAPVGRRFSGDHTAKALELLTGDEPVLYKSLLREDATLQNIQALVKSFQPDIIHFDGHVTVGTSPDPDALELYLAGSDKASTPDLAHFLTENGVQLLVFGRNSMAQMFQNIGTRAAFLFAQQGLPAVIAPVRAIDDASATTFTTEFYRAFLQGNKLEAALQIARRKLASRGGDWSVFALFADPFRLDQFQLLREPAMA